MRIKKLLKNTKGDTIVEVLLSIGVMSLVLVVSYSLANKNTRYIQHSQERGEAQKVTEEQLELLRDYLKPGAEWRPQYICMYIDPVTGKPKPATSAEASECVRGIDDRYDMRILVTDSDGDGEGDTYTVHTNWSSLTSEEDQTLELSYKLPASLFSPDEFIAPDEATVTVIAKKIPPRAPDGSPVASAGTANPSCSDSGRVDKFGTQVSTQYIDPDGNRGPLKVGSTDNSSTHAFHDLGHYGTFESKVTAPSQYSICGVDTKTQQLLRPETNITENFVIKPNCVVTNDYVRTDQHAIWSTAWVQDVPIYGNVAIYGWVYQTWFWWSYWPPGYGSANPPYNTVFQSGGNQLVLREVRTGHPNANYRYEHYIWGVTGYSWQVVGWGWRSYQYISGYWYEDIYELRNHCPS